MISTQRKVLLAESITGETEGTVAAMSRLTGALENEQCLSTGLKRAMALARHVKFDHQSFEAGDRNNWQSAVDSGSGLLVDLHDQAIRVRRMNRVTRPKTHEAIDS